MSAKRQNASPRGPSWADVDEALRYYEGEYDVQLTFVTVINRGERGTRYGLVIRLGGGKASRDTRGPLPGQITWSWPSPHFKTMPALYLAMMAQWEEDLIKTQELGWAASQLRLEDTGPNAFKFVHIPRGTSGD